MKVLAAQSFQTLCDPMDSCLPGSTVHGFLWIRILKWVVIPFSRGYSQAGTYINSQAHTHIIFTKMKSHIIKLILMNSYTLTHENVLTYTFPQTSSHVHSHTFSYNPIIYNSPGTRHSQTAS